MVHMRKFSPAAPRALALAVLFFAAPLAPAQQVWADEDRDWGVGPVMSLRQAPYSAPTPTSIPGARVARTLDMRELVGRQPPPILIDVAGGDNCPDRIGHSLVIDNLIETVTGGIGVGIQLHVDTDWLRHSLFMAMNTNARQKLEIADENTNSHLLYDSGNIGGTPDEMLAAVHGDHLTGNRGGVQQIAHCAGDIGG